MGRVLRAQEPLKEHPNRGIRGKIIEQLGGDEARYFEAFRKAALGSLPDDRARPARLADLFKTLSAETTKGLGLKLLRCWRTTERGHHRRQQQRPRLMRLLRRASNESGVHRGAPGLARPRPRQAAQRPWPRAEMCWTQALLKRGRRELRALPLQFPSAWAPSSDLSLIHI